MSNTLTLLKQALAAQAAQNLVLTGGAGYTAPNGGAGDNRLDGRTGAVSLSGTSGYNLFAGTDSDDVVWGRTMGNKLLGLGGNDTLIGSDGIDLLDGGTGADSMSGGAGDDTYLVDNVGDQVIELEKQGTDTVRSSIDDYSLLTNVYVENLALVGAARVGTGNDLANTLTANDAGNSLYGLAGNDTLIGGSRNDRLDGGMGADSMSGGAGDDTYIVDNIGDVVVEAADQGADMVVSSVSYSLATKVNVENLTLTGGAVLVGTGNGLNNVITANDMGSTIRSYAGDDTLIGGSGKDWLDGGAGADSMSGGAGDDTYTVDDTGDKVIEAENQGTDTVQSSITYSLVTNVYVEKLTLVGAARVGTGNDLANTLTANDAGNKLSGGTGNDTLIGGTGNDSLDGGTDADTMKGGAGDDTYVVDNSRDVVIDLEKQGTDTVQSSINYSLGTYTENLTLTGSAARFGVGNNFHNVITANNAGNRLDGGPGNDTLNGGSGNDTLTGESGNDSMTGGAGDDTYYVEEIGDVVVEVAEQGTDTVYSSISTYTLGSIVENLTLYGYLGGVQVGTGNGLNNVITANQNLGKLSKLSGLAGNDTLIGSGGKDTLDGGTGADILMGSTGDDVLDGSDDCDVLQGGAGNDFLNDTLGSNLLVGGAGDDRITAGYGNLLVGGTGNDTLRTGVGKNVLAFNRGDGLDTILMVAGAQNTLSFGKISVNAVTLRHDGNNLILDAGGGDRLTFRDWYVGMGNQTITTLQFFEEETAEYSDSNSAAFNKKVASYDFDRLVSAADLASSRNQNGQYQYTGSNLDRWFITNGLSKAFMSSSITDAVGGDLAYQYAQKGSFEGYSLSSTQTTLQAGQFGISAQSLIQPDANSLPANDFKLVA